MLHLTVTLPDYDPQEMAAFRAQINTSSVSVEVDAKPQQDLNKILATVRSQYEGITDKNRRDMDAWYKVKVRGANDTFNSIKLNLIKQVYELIESMKQLEQLCSLSCFHSSSLTA